MALSLLQGFRPCREHRTLASSAHEEAEAPMSKWTHWTCTKKYKVQTQPSPEKCPETSTEGESPAASGRLVWFPQTVTASMPPSWFCGESVWHTIPTSGFLRSLCLLFWVPIQSFLQSQPPCALWHKTTFTPCLWLGSRTHCGEGLSLLIVSGVTQGRELCDFVTPTSGHWC